MATQVLITVGKNELPCLVSARRLYEHYSKKDGAPPRLILVCTTKADTATLTEAIKEHVHEASAEPLVVCDAFDPAKIFEMVRAAKLFNQSNNQDIFHINYTGGTKAMGLHTYEALKSRFPNATFELSYLAPDRHVLRTTAGAILPPSPYVDERQTWPKLQLAQLAALRSFPEPDPTDVDEQLIQLSKATLAHLLPKAGKNLDFLTEWNRVKKIKAPLTWNPDWLPCTDQLRQYRAWSGLFKMPTGETRWRIPTRGSKEDEPAIKRLDKFLNNEYLEVIAYVALKAALNDPNRVWHSVEFTVAKDRTFEIDVLALLGYQVLAVSCSFGTNPQSVKLKAFEVLHRARQFGGDQARMIVLSPMEDDAIGALEADINADLGVSGHSESSLPPVKIFGRSTMIDPDGKLDVSALTRRFKEYLQGTKWT